VEAPLQTYTHTPAGAVTFVAGAAAMWMDQDRIRYGYDTIAPRSSRPMPPVRVLYIL